jgi:hypothetical protein
MCYGTGKKYYTYCNEPCELPVNVAYPAIPNNADTTRDVRMEA